MEFKAQINTRNSKPCIELYIATNEQGTANRITRILEANCGLNYARTVSVATGKVVFDEDTLGVRYSGDKFNATFSVAFTSTDAAKRIAGDLNVSAAGKIQLDKVCQQYLVAVTPSKQ